MKITSVEISIKGSRSQSWRIELSITYVHQICFFVINVHFPVKYKIYFFTKVNVILSPLQRESGFTHNPHTYAVRTCTLTRLYQTLLTYNTFVAKDVLTSGFTLHALMLTSGLSCIVCTFLVHTSVESDLHIKATQWGKRRKDGKGSKEREKRQRPLA